MLESQLASPGVTQEQKDNIRYQLEAKKRLVETKERVEGTKNCIWFGWMDHKTLSGAKVIAGRILNLIQ